MCNIIPIRGAIENIIIPFKMIYVSNYNNIIEYFPDHRLSFSFIYVQYNIKIGFSLDISY